MKEFLEYAESHAEEILGTLRHMVEMESFTADKASTDVLGGFIKERFEELGAQVRLVPQEGVGDHLVADVGEGDQQVLLLCHMDTVWPTGTIQQRPFRVEAGLGYGPGILDMKAGIAIVGVKKRSCSPKNSCTFRYICSRASIDAIEYDAFGSCPCSSSSSR